MRVPRMYVLTTAVVLKKKKCDMLLNSTSALLQVVTLNFKHVIALQVKLSFYHYLRQLVFAHMYFRCSTLTRHWTNWWQVFKRFRTPKMSIGHFLQLIHTIAGCCFKSKSKQNHFMTIGTGLLLGLLLFPSSVLPNISPFALYLLLPFFVVVCIGLSILFSSVASFVSLWPHLADNKICKWNFNCFPAVKTRMKWSTIVLPLL